MNDEEFFLNTLVDLREKFHREDSYSTIKAAGLLRQLLLDDSPLIHLVNRKYNLKILFTVCGRKRAERQFKRVNVFYSALSMIHLSGSQGHTAEKVVLDTFLSMKVIKNKDQELTVRDVLTQVAYADGGSHRGKLKITNEKAPALSDLSRVENGSTSSINWEQMRPIIMIVLDALAPLEKKVRQSQFN